MPMARGELARQKNETGQLMKSTMTSRRSVGDRQLRGSGLPRCLRDCWAGSGAAGDRPGQPARRFGNGPLLHLRRRRRLARGGPSQPPSDRHVLGRAHHPPGLADRRQGEREPADQPGRVRGQQARSSGRLSSPRSRPRRAAPTRRRRSMPTCSASSTSTSAPAAASRASRRASSTCRTAASTSCSRSTRATRPASRRSTSSATAPISNSPPARS